MNIKILLDDIVSDGQLTAQEHREFISAIKADGKIDKAELAQINRLIALISAGEIKVI